MKWHNVRGKPLNGSGPSSPVMSKSGRGDRGPLANLRRACRRQVTKLNPFAETCSTGPRLFTVEPRYLPLGILAMILAMAAV
jgi:hypothetical protein